MPRALTITRKVSVEELEQAARTEECARIRVRILAVRMVLLGNSCLTAASELGLGETRTCAWIKRFNENGFEGLRDLPRAPRRSRLAPEKVKAFKNRLLAGATEKDGVGILHGKDIQCILRDEFDANCSLSGTYFILHRIGLSSLMPRSRHPQSDPKAQAAFKKTSCGT